MTQTHSISQTPAPGKGYVALFANGEGCILAVAPTAEAAIAEAMSHGHYGPDAYVAKPATERLVAAIEGGLWISSWRTNAEGEEDLEIVDTED